MATATANIPAIRLGASLSALLPLSAFPDDDDVDDDDVPVDELADGTVDAVVLKML